MSSHKTQGSLGAWPAATLGEYRVEAVAWVIVLRMVGKMDLAKSDCKDAEGMHSGPRVHKHIKQQVRGRTGGEPGNWIWGYNQHYRD